MPADNSFDIVCKVDMQEVTNAVDQARREVDTRYDLKGSKNEIVLEKTDIVITAADEMKLKAVVDILQSKLHKRGVPLKALTYGNVVLDLTPKQPLPTMARLVLAADPRTWEVRKAVVYDQFENTVTMLFRKTTVNGGLPDSLFTFVAPKGVSTVPLR